MTFLAPLGLLALISLPLIVLLHLMRERRRRVLVPSLLLWQQLSRRHQAQRRRRLPLTLLLLLHLLAAALLSLALASPQWLTDLLGRTQHTVVIIDTSASMAAPAGGLDQASRLDAARARARALIGSMGGRDTLTLIAAGPQPRLLASAGPAGAGRLLAALDRLRPGGSGSDMPGALTLAAADMQGQPAGRAFVITDAALPTLDADLRRAPQDLAISWEQVGSTLPNRALLTLAARPQSGGQIQVYARAANYSSAAARSVVRLYADDTLLDTRVASFPAQNEVELTWIIPPGAAILRAEIDGNDGMPADDSATLSLAASRPLRVRLVSAAPAALARVLTSIPGVSLERLEPSAYAGQESPAIDLTILDGVLPDRWPAGAVLAINPPSSGDLLDMGLVPISPEPDQGTLSANGTIFDGLSLGSIDFGPTYAISPPEWARTLLRRGEQPLILRGSSGRSQIAIWAFDLSQGNLTSRLAFPLLLARTVRDLTPPALPGAALAGQDVTLQPDPRADTLELRAPDGATRRIAIPADGAITLSVDTPGVYTLREIAGDSTIFSGQLAINAGSARESNLTPRQLPPASFAPSPTARDLARSSKPLWPWLVVVALMVMLGEWFYVHARRIAGGFQGG